VRYDLKPLDSGDIKGYVEHRLVVAGGRGDVKFSKGALKKIFAYSRGNPRRINAVCDRALLIAYTVERHTVSERMLAKAIEEVRGDTRASSRMGDVTSRRFGIAVFSTLLIIVVMALGGWTLREDIFKLFSNEQEKAVIKAVHIPRKPVRPIKKAAALYLDEQSSLVGLFRLFNEIRNSGRILPDEVHLELVSFPMGPEYHAMFKKPFRMRLSDTQTFNRMSSAYLLIREITENGAVAIDADGNEHVVTTDFILRNWGFRVSWFFPYKTKNVQLIKGMNSPDVLEVQKILHKTGFRVECTGAFDESTFNEIMRFQENFGLEPDGIVGPQTMAILYLMS